MEVVGTVVSIISLCTSGSPQESLAEKYKHLTRPTNNLIKLKSSMEELEARKGGVQNKLDQLQLEKGMEPTEEVRLWMKSVCHVHSEVSSLIDESEASSGCCYFRSRIKLGERIEKKIKDIVSLLEKGQMPDDSIAETVTKRGYTIPVMPLMGYETQVQSLMMIWGLLLDHRVRRIGVCGMGGVGKTTIMTEINNRLLKETSHFNSVIWVKISMDSSLEKVQKDIAVKLGLSVCENDDEIVRASRLFEAFNRRKKFVLILDDLWDSFSLERVGIPVPTVENGCKLVIITRLVRTCQAMETDEDVEVQVLSENEAWNLFKDKVGDKALTSSSAIQSIAMDVAKECGGLPLAIVTVGLAMRNTTDISQWENALAELRASSTGIDNIDEVVFSCLKLSYTKLKDDTRRSCFLFCALYQEGHLIDADELINYWIWEGLLGGSSTLENKRKGKIILNELRCACLLESKTHNGVELIKLHDLIRDMAITIMRENPQCIVNAGIGVAKPPHLDDWTEDVQRVSLMRNDVKSINFKPRCPRLTCLLLQYNSFADRISQDFFDSMLGLKVLDLSYTGISFLPVSLSNLENLCALLLSHCWNLQQVPSLAKLTKLKALDLSFTRNLTKLPHGMEHLTNLRRLNFSLTCIENLPVGLISKFTLLEDLLIAGSPVIGVSSRVERKKLFAVGIEELISCPTLSVLHMGFAELEAFNEYAKSGHCCQLKEYKLAVGYYFVDAPMLSEKTSFAINGKLLNFMCNISPGKTGEYNKILEIQLH